MFTCPYHPERHTYSAWSRTMKNKKILAAAVVAATMILVLIILVMNLGEKKKIKQEHIIAQRYRAKLQESERNDRQEVPSNENVRDYFTDDIVNEHTLNFFQYLDKVCIDAEGLADNLEQAREYLYSVLPPQTAERMLVLYQSYLHYQISLPDKIAAWGIPKTTDQALENLANLQDYRRAIFGEEIADIIFGASVVAQEYAIRRNAIFYDDNLYGSEKEKLLRVLHKDMWGDELTVDANVPAYTRYQEKLQLYKKDIAELRTEEEREAFLQHVRMEVFDPVQRQRLQKVERFLAEEKIIKEQYLEQEKEILQNPELSEKEKEKKIRELQDATFGEEADAFRRRQIMEKELEKNKKSLNTSGD
jgi:lipase chaperone LimK